MILQPIQILCLTPIFDLGQHGAYPQDSQARRGVPEIIRAIEVLSNEIIVSKEFVLRFGEKSSRKSALPNGHRRPWPGCEDSKRNLRRKFPQEEGLYAHPVPWYGTDLVTGQALQTLLPSIYQAVRLTRSMSRPGSSPQQPKAVEEWRQEECLSDRD